MLRRFLLPRDHPAATAPAPAAAQDGEPDDGPTVRRIVAELEAMPHDRARYLAGFAYILGRAAFARSDFAEAERRFRGVVKNHPDTDAAPEALYWAGVAKYKATGDAAALAETYKQFQSRYKDTSWATKASVWGK